MSTTHGLGEFEQFVLLSILRLDDTAYGVRIQVEITNTPGVRWRPEPCTRHCNA